MQTAAWGAAHLARFRRIGKQVQHSDRGIRARRSRVGKEIVDVREDPHWRERRAHGVPARVRSRLWVVIQNPAPPQPIAGRCASLANPVLQPHGCEWDAKTREKMDKDRFRQGLGGVIEAYEEVGRRIGIEFD